MIHQERILGTLELLTAALHGNAHDPIRWGMAWRGAMAQIKVRSVLKSCREMQFEGSVRQKSEASFVARTVRRGREYASQVDEIERDLLHLYPADKARERLDGELGWDHGELDPITTRLDRTMMIARVNAPPLAQLRSVAHEYARGQFGDLENMQHAGDA